MSRRRRLVPWRRRPSCSTVALDQTYDYLVPDGLELEPGCFVLVPFGPQSRIGVVWDNPVGEHRQARRSQEAQDHRRAPRRAAAAADLAAVRRVDRALLARPSRHGRAHDDERAHRLRAGEAALRRDARGGRVRAAAHDAGAPARARRGGRRRDPRQVGARRRGPVLDRRRRRARGVGKSRRGGDPGEARPAARSQAPRHRVHARAGAGRARAAVGGRWRQLLGLAARRRHRLGQDRGLLRGGRAHAASAGSRR